MAKSLCSISYELNRQIGVLIDRSGNITHVIIGTAHSIFIPPLEDFPIGKKQLRGLRYIHTHLNKEMPDREDITDLRLLRFDLVAVLTHEKGIPETVHIVHLLPYGKQNQFEIISSNLYSLKHNFKEFIDNLEAEMDRARVIDMQDPREKAILISVSTAPKYILEEHMEELKELAESADLIVIDKIIQRVKQINPKYLLGEGKLRELIIKAMDMGATLLVFDQNLTPSQIRAITDMTELKVIDRSQLILDIFAKRAHTMDGKVQVELAQLRYMLPRLTGKGTAMSRLAGGIGGRGPGETKLELDRRRINKRIHHLENELEKLTLARIERKKRRKELSIPIVSIIGYTNAGKSTLLNALTKSSVFVEDKMFATLDTSSRRLKFPEEKELIITDTVGFIRDLPDDLVAAFKATLEELQDASLLIHLVDISNPQFENHIESVNRILSQLGLDIKPVILVFNKIDKLSSLETKQICNRYNAIGISAIDKKTLIPLIDEIKNRLWEEKVTCNAPL
ncbi:GTPase HflX [Thermodesulfovibrio yellowstonii]|uniref:GTPase HflX n=1 Tax=Thermodesulfovibrio yellowstonii TaxID=28262 RepID=UPI0024B33FF9|nr:GTPase HflX [Thermodesulfovibrio yellowstonii]MDI6864913.1 GTPase HflX [Thermodesulfovibrio yellowstonii]